MECAVYRATSIIGKRWTLLILLELYKRGSKAVRYTKLRKSLPAITPKILSARLKELEKEGLISKRIDAHSVPIKCEYSFTESGEEFIHVIKGIKKWVLQWKMNTNLCRNLDCRDCSL